MKRQRGRGRKNNSNNSNRSFDSNGPGIKVRGTASNIYEKYSQLARDELSSGDRVQAENYLQHAEHYYRILQTQQAAQQAAQKERDDRQRDRDDDTRADSDDDGEQGTQTHAAEDNAQEPSRRRPRRGRGQDHEDTSETDIITPQAAVEPASGSDAPSAADGDDQPSAPPRRGRRRKSDANDAAGEAAESGDAVQATA